MAVLKASPYKDYENSTQEATYGYKYTGHHDHNPDGETLKGLAEPDPGRHRRLAALDSNIDLNRPRGRAVGTKHSEHPLVSLASGMTSLVQ